MRSRPGSGCCPPRSASSCAAIGGSALSKRFAARPIVRVGLGDRLRLDAAAARHDRPDARLRLVPRRDGRARRRDGARRLPARQRRPVVDRRRRPERGRRPPEHRRPARLLARHRAARRGRHHRPDRRLLRATSPPTPRISADVKQEVEVRLSSGGSFVSSEQVRTAAEEAGVDQATADALVEDYENVADRRPEDGVPVRRR